MLFFVYNMISFTTPSVTFGFIIPVGQAEGNYTLRIGTFSVQGNNFNACSTASGYGEMEDYTFKVVTDCPAKVLRVGLLAVHLYLSVLFSCRQILHRNVLFSLPLVGAWFHL